MPDHVPVELDTDVSREPGAHHLVLRAGGLVAEAKPGELQTGSARVRGLFWEDHHGYTHPDLPSTRGTVRRIHFACQAYERRDGEPDWDSPKWVSLTDTTHSDNRVDANGELSRGDDATFVTYIGWLVDLEVAG